MATTYTVSSGQTLSGTTLLSGSTSVGTITLNAGDTLIVASGGTAEALAVTGETIKVSNGGTTRNLAISSGGVEILSAGATGLNTSVYNGGTVTLAGNAVDTGLYVGSGGLLDLTLPTGSQTAPINVASGGQIEFGGVAASGTVTSTTTTSTTTFNVSAGNVAHESITVSGGGLTFTSATVGNGTNKHDVFTITCFLSGTNLQVAEGEAAIETLQAGDAVAVMRDGTIRLETIRWIGHSTVDLARHAHPELAAPIRIKAGALSAATPVRDLVVSPEHCMIVDGHCVPAKLLVNGTTIVREYPQTPFMYYHVELEQHGILIAEGAEAELYLDTGNRSAFDNADEPRMLHPTFEINADAERWKTEACAPLATTADEVAPIWQGLADRAAALGFQLPAVEAVEDPDLHLVVDGRRIEAISDRDARFVFAVPAGAKSVTLASRASIPADRMDPMVRDSRRIGVRVLWAAIRAGEEETIFPADHPELRNGWHAVETYGPAPWRWTNGAATIPWQNVEGPAMLTVRCYPSGWYAVEQNRAAIAA